MITHQENLNLFNYFKNDKIYNKVTNLCVSFKKFVSSVSELIIPNQVQCSILNIWKYEIV